MAQWWNVNSTIPYDNKNFQRILDFYLFKCPVTIDGKRDKKPIKKNVAQRAITFEEKRWTGNHLTALLRIMKGNIVFEEVSTSELVEHLCEKTEIDSSQSDPHFEMIVYYPSVGKTKSIFYSIRNAFAHGSFSVVQNNKEWVYYFESRTDKGLRARIRLKEKTLLSWIEQVEKEPKGLESYKKTKHRNKVNA